MTVHSKTKSGWSQITHNKKKAYVSTQYLDFSKPAVKVKRLSHEKFKEIKYAQVSGAKSKKTEEAINKTFRKHANDAYSYHMKLKRNEQKDGAFLPDWCSYFNESDFRTKFNKGKELSVLVQDYEYSCGAHGMQWITVFNYNLNNGKRVKLNDVLTTKTKKAKVQKYAYNYIRKHPTRFSPGIKQSEIKINNATQFYYYDSGIVLIFQAYEVGPYAAGNPTIKIPASVYK